MPNAVAAEQHKWRLGTADNESRLSAVIASALIDRRNFDLRARRWRNQTVYGWRDPLHPRELVPVLSAVRKQISRDLERVRRPIERGLAAAADADHAD